MDLINANILSVDTATEACSASLYTKGRVYTRYQIAPQKHANLILNMCQDLLQEASIERNMLDVIAFGAGPGAFTGVRIATSMAQGLALGLNCPLLACSDLKALALGYLLNHKDIDKFLAISAIDARMGEVYFALYECSFKLKQELNITTLISESVSSPIEAVEHIIDKINQYQQLNANNTPFYLAGSGINLLLDHDLSTLNMDLCLNQQIVALSKSDGFCAPCKNKVDQILDSEGALYPQAQSILLLRYVNSAQIELLDPAAAEPVYCRNDVAWKKLNEQ